METINTAADLRTWILNSNPGNILAEPEHVDELVEALRGAPGRPAWGSDWSEWLDAHAEREALALFE